MAVHEWTRSKGLINLTWALLFIGAKNWTQGHVPTKEALHSMHTNLQRLQRLQTAGVWRPEDNLGCYPYPSPQACKATGNWAMFPVHVAFFPETGSHYVVLASLELTK